MSNEVINILKFIGDKKEVEKALAFISSPERIIDLNKIKLMPEALCIDNISDGYSALFLFFEESTIHHDYTMPEVRKTFADLSADDQAKAIQIAYIYYLNIRKYGYPTRYEWALNNWGTKWNAYNGGLVSDEEHAIHIVTPDHSPIFAFIELSRLFPEIKLRLHLCGWSDPSEQTDYLYFENGKTTEVFRESENGMILKKDF